MNSFFCCRELEIDDVTNEKEEAKKIRYDNKRKRPNKAHTLAHIFFSSKKGEKKTAYIDYKKRKRPCIVEYV